MLRRLFVRVLICFAVRVVALPCAVWFGSRVLVIAPGVGLFTLSPDEARQLATKLHLATTAETNPQR